MLRALKVFPIEVIVRGYITGSAWDESVSPCLLRKSPSAASTILTFLCVGTKSSRQFTAFRSPQDCSADGLFPAGEPGGPRHPGAEGDELGGGAGAGGGAGHGWVAVV